MPGDFGGHWLSKTDLDFTIELAGKDVTATITAKNVGDQEEPMSIGWHPYFAIPERRSHTGTAACSRGGDGAGEQL